MSRNLASLTPQIRQSGELLGRQESDHKTVMLVLAISGFDTDPDSVTEMLGFNPTSVGRKGAPLPSGRPRTFNGWWYDAEAECLFEGGQHHDALSRILDQIRGREANFGRLRAAIQPEKVDIYGGLYLRPERQCGIWLDPDQMQLLAACRIGWGLDLFIDE